MITVLSQQNDNIKENMIMLKSIEGIYQDGKIELSELPQNISSDTKVIVTFLEEIQVSSELVKQLPITYHDLDSLAGTWSEEDAREFSQNTAIFSQIVEQGN
jgi:hypothetical protein